MKKIERLRDEQIMLHKVSETTFVSILYINRQFPLQMYKKY